MAGSISLLSTTGSKGPLLLKAREALRRLLDEPAGSVMQQPNSAASSAKSMLLKRQQRSMLFRVGPDPQRAFAKLRYLLFEADIRRSWHEGKAHAKDRLREAYEMVGRRYNSSSSALSSAGANSAPAAAQGWAVAAQTPPPPAAAPAAAAETGAADAQLAPMYGSDGWARTALMYMLAHASRGFMQGLNTTTVEGAQHMAAAMARPPGTPLLTVCNHVASVDDPLVMSAVIPREYFSQALQLRWTLCATDRCFHTAALVPFFRAAKVLPVARGAGMLQPGLAAAEARLAGGEWVHIFPEGTRSRDGRMGPVRKGIGRLVAAAAAAPAAPVGSGGASAPAPEQQQWLEAAPPPPPPQQQQQQQQQRRRRAPMIVPFVHSGMEEVMPRGSMLPKVGKEVKVLVGEPIDVSDLLAASSSQGWEEDHLFKAIANRVGARLHALKAQLDGRRLEAGEQLGSEALVSGLDLYDPIDNVGRGPGLLTGLWHEVSFAEFRSRHREWWEASLAAAAANLRRTGGGSGGSGGASAGSTEGAGAALAAAAATSRMGSGPGGRGSQTLQGLAAAVGADFGGWQYLEEQRAAMMHLLHLHQ